MEHINDIYMQYYNVFASKEKHKRPSEGRVVFSVGNGQGFSVAVPMPLYTPQLQTDLWSSQNMRARK
jgi:hypothetical protein